MYSAPPTQDPGIKNLSKWVHADQQNRALSSPPFEPKSTGGFRNDLRHSQTEWQKPHEFKGTS